MNLESKFDPYDAVSVPIYQTATFKQVSPRDYFDFAFCQLGSVFFHDYEREKMFFRLEHKLYAIMKLCIGVCQCGERLGLGRSERICFVLVLWKA